MSHDAHAKPGVASKVPRARAGPREPGWRGSHARATELIHCSAITSRHLQPAVETTTDSVASAGLIRSGNGQGRAMPLLFDRSIMVRAGPGISASIHPAWPQLIEPVEVFRQVDPVRREFQPGPRFASYDGAGCMVDAMLRLVTAIVCI